MAKKNSAKKSVKSTGNLDVWANVDRQTNEPVNFFPTRSEARMNREEGHTTRAYTLVPRK